MHKHTHKHTHTHTLTHTHKKLTSVQDGIYALRTVQNYSLKKFPQCCLWKSANVVLSKSTFLLFVLVPFQKNCQALPSSMPLSSRKKMAWCPWLYARRQIHSSSTIHVLWDASCLWWSLCQPVYLRNHFLRLQHVHKEVDIKCRHMPVWTSHPASHFS